MSKQRLGGDRSKRRVAHRSLGALPFYSAGMIEQAMTRERRAIQKLTEPQKPKEVTDTDRTRIEAAKEKRARKAIKRLKLREHYGKNN